MKSSQKLKLLSSSVCSGFCNRSTAHSRARAAVRTGIEPAAAQPSRWETITRVGAQRSSSNNDAVRATNDHVGGAALTGRAGCSAATGSLMSEQFHQSLRRPNRPFGGGGGWSVSKNTCRHREGLWYLASCSAKRQMLSAAHLCLAEQERESSFVSSLITLLAGMNMQYAAQWRKNRKQLLSPFINRLIYALGCQSYRSFPNLLFCSSLAYSSNLSLN